MALIVGLADCSTGMSKTILDALIGGGLADGVETKAFCHALAVAIVAEITTHAVVLPGTMNVSGNAVTGAGIVT